jgi:phosphoenolpyruvate-protein phosphotransferase (PTS system enzyme I)
LIVDGMRGVVIVNPDQRVLEEYRLRMEQIELEKTKLKRLKTSPSVTLDGIDVALHANIELPGDVRDALEGGADGIGLFRTEFLFLDRGDMPDEQEQYEAYKKVVKGMGWPPGHHPHLRSGQRQGSAAEQQRQRPRQDQPGARPAGDPPVAVRTEDVPDPVAGHPARVEIRPIKLLIPMLAHAHEIDQTLAALEQAKSSLRGEKVASTKISRSAA